MSMIDRVDSNFSCGHGQMMNNWGNDFHSHCHHAGNDIQNPWSNNQGQDQNGCGGSNSCGGGDSDGCGGSYGNQNGQIANQMMQQGNQLINEGQQLLQSGDTKDGMKLIHEGSHLMQQASQMQQSQGGSNDGCSGGDSGGCGAAGGIQNYAAANQSAYAQPAQQSSDSSGIGNIIGDVASVATKVLPLLALL